jgi:hypothetical protein
MGAEIDQFQRTRTTDSKEKKSGDAGAKKPDLTPGG